MYLTFTIDKYSIRPIVRLYRLNSTVRAVYVLPCGIVYRSSDDVTTKAAE